MVKQQQREINVNIPKDLEACFSNQTQISHKDDEVTFSFIHLTPLTTGSCKAIVTMTPQHAKRFCKALQENIKMYENSFGEIKLKENLNNETPKDVMVG